MYTPGLECYSAKRSAPPNLLNTHIYNTHMQGAAHHSVLKSIWITKDIVILNEQLLIRCWLGISNKFSSEGTPLDSGAVEGRLLPPLMSKSLYGRASKLVAQVAIVRGCYISARALSCPWYLLHTNAES